MAVHALGQDEGLRVAKVFAAGNKADITDAELLGYLRQDPETRVICLLLESITDARRFFTEACLTTPVKPVIAVVGGRTGAGQRAAVSHTAALAADDAVRDAALRQAGVVRVRTGLQVLDAARALSGQPMPRGRAGRRGHQLRRYRSGTRRPTGRRGSAGPGTEPGPASGTAGAAAGLRQRGQPGGHDARVEPVHHGVPGGDRAAGPVGRDRRGGAGAAAAVRFAGGGGGGPGRGGPAPGGRDSVPVYVCWVAPRSADAHAGMLQEAGIPCFAVAAAGRAGRRGSGAVRGPGERVGGGPGTGRVSRRRSGIRPHRRRPRRPAGAGSWPATGCWPRKPHAPCSSTPGSR